MQPKYTPTETYFVYPPPGVEPDRQPVCEICGAAGDLWPTATADGWPELLCEDCLLATQAERRRAALGGVE
jgi:hypothetical protein